MPPKGSREQTAPRGSQAEMLQSGQGLGAAPWAAGVRGQEWAQSRAAPGKKMWESWSSGSCPVPELKKLWRKGKRWVEEEKRPGTRACVVGNGWSSHDTSPQSNKAPPVTGKEPTFRWDRVMWKAPLCSRTSGTSEARRTACTHAHLVLQDVCPAFTSSNRRSSQWMPLYLLSFSGKQPS